MSIERRTFLGSGIALLAASAAGAQRATPWSVATDQPFFPPKESFPLWPGSPPGAPKTPIKPNWTMNNPPPNRELWIRGVAMPEVHVYRPARADGSSLLVFPGGGYGFLSIQNEGLDPAERFNAERTTCFLLTYRLPGEGWSNRSLVPLQDAQRAMRLIRARAQDFNIDPSRLGVLGFSAGGHLAADLAVSHSESVYRRVDAVDGISARPAFAGLIYPVISLDPTKTLGDSQKNLLGPSPSPQLVADRSPLHKVTAQTPPTFVVSALDDGLVLPPNELEWIAACREAKASVEAHLFAQGGHGFGLHLPKDNPGSRWPDLFALWMRQHGA